uniref:Uncharacterized protein n=1 Tax=Siphoviridae sp. ctTfn5 TaxID=2827878 RepID=A0A8S5TH90_9CAUD|nr:MAG TPA: hypothetical protein [Siphoviridae sp. ctTfn5]
MSLRELGELLNSLTQLILFTTILFFVRVQ